MKKKRIGKLLSILLASAVCIGVVTVGIPERFIKSDFNTTVSAVSYRTIYVDEKGNDFTGNGSSQSPYRSIKKAASEATAGTTVLVRAGTYIEEDIKPKESGTKDAMIVFRPASDADKGKVIIKHNDRFTGSTVTPQVRAAWLQDTGWKEEEVKHYDNAGIEYSIAARKNELTDVFNLFGRDYVWVEGFIFEDYKYARSTIDIMGKGNVVINNQFKNIGCVYNAPWQWSGQGVYRPDVTIPVAGEDNVIRNNYFQSVYGETLCYDNHSQNCIISENTFIGAIGKNAGAGGSESSTLGGRADGNRNNAFAFNYSGGSVNGGTIWLDISVRDFTAVRNVAHNTAYFMFNESECTRNWAYENIVYNKPLDENKRMVGSTPYFMNFPAQKIESGLFSAYWDTGSTWDARWVNNVTYNLKNGICLDRSYNNEVRNNIAYEDENSMYSANDTLGILVKETTINGFHAWHGIDLKGGGFQIFRNNLWYSPRKPNYVRYMDPSQPAITVDAFNKQIGSKTELAEDPMFVNAAAGDFSLKEGSPAIGTGDGGVNRGAYAVYPKTDAGCNQSLGLIQDVNVSFSELNSSVKPGDVINLKLNLNKAAAGTMSFKVTPVAGDARPDEDFSFIDDPSVTFKAGDTSKSVRVKILEGYDLDQLLVFRIDPAGTTKTEAVGARDMHLVRINRAEERVLVLSNIGDSMGQIVASYHKPGDLVTIDAKTRAGYTFDGWQVGIDAMELKPVSPNGSVSTFIMPEYNQRIQAKWKLNGAPVGVTGITLNRSELAINAGDSVPLSATVKPDNASDKVVLWTSSNPLVASVDKNGVVKGWTQGTAEIIARTLENSDKQFTAKCKVSVTGNVDLPDVPDPGNTGTETAYTKFADGTPVKIINKKSGLAMTVSGDEDSQGNVRQETFEADNPECTWHLYKAGTNGYYYIMSDVYDGMTLPLFADSKTGDIAVKFDTATSGYASKNEYQFKLSRNSDGTFKILPKIFSDKKVVEVYHATDEEKENIATYQPNGGANQFWTIETVEEKGNVMETDVYYTFKNVSSGLVMDIDSGKPENGQNILQWNSSGESWQKWQLEAADTKSAENCYYIKSVCDPDYVVTLNDTNIEIIGKDSKPARLFRFRKNMDGSYTIVSKTGKVIEVADSSKTAGANVKVGAPDGGGGQKWNAVTEKAPVSAVTTTSATTKKPTETTTKAKTTASATTKKPAATTTKDKTTAATTKKPTATTTKAKTTAAATTKKPTTTNKPSGIKGDINGDKKVNVADLVELQNFIVRCDDVLLPAMDINEDKYVNVFDAVMLRRMLLGK